MTKPSQAEIDAEIERIEREHERWTAAREEKISQIEGIFAVTPAVGGSFRGEPRMALKTGELSDTKYGPLRVTFFAADGPHGHVTKKTDRAAAEAVLDFLEPPFHAMSEVDVLEFTTTPTFERGARIVAIVQAENVLRYFAQRVGRIDWAYDVIRERGNLQFDEVPLERLDDELARLHAAIRELPVPNPQRYKPFVQNPAWVTGILADHYEVLDDKVPARWMPQLRHVAPAGKSKLAAELVEFGCGAYGCVLATADPDTVLKVTSDETEAEFAAQLAPELVAPVCVEYRLVVRVNARHQGAQVHLLWREAAEHVGEIETALGLEDPERGRHARVLIDMQHIAAQDAYKALAQGWDEKIVAKRIERWLDSVERWARQTQVPELRPLAEGILAIWREQHIFFGDIHTGNVGLVKRDGNSAWVITDPGNIAVIADDRYW